MSSPSKSDAYTTEVRVDAVRLLLLTGKEDTSRLVQDIAAKFGVNTRQAYNYVAKAKQQIEEVGAIDRTYRLAEHIAIRRDIRRRARDANDLRMELAAAQDEAKLLGVYPSDRHEISGPNGEPIEQNTHVFSHETVSAALATRSTGYRVPPGADENDSDGPEVG